MLRILFDWTQSHRDVTLEFDGGYMGNPSTMCITMRHKRHPHRVRQIISDVAIDALYVYANNVYNLLDDMYRVLMKEVKKEEQGGQR